MGALCSLVSRGLAHLKIQMVRFSYRREMANRMEDNSEFLEELARQTSQLRQEELESMPRQGSLTDQVTHRAPPLSTIRTNVLSL